LGIPFLAVRVDGVLQAYRGRWVPDDNANRGAARRGQARRRGGVNARLGLLDPKQRDRFVGRWLDRVDIAFGRRSRANYDEAQNGEKRGRAGALAGNAVGEWQKGRSWTSFSVADEARYRSRPRWWKRTEGGPPGERLGVGPFGLDGLNVGHGLIAPDPGEGLGSPQLTGR
jgi:hypothetical protein